MQTAIQMLFNAVHSDVQTGWAKETHMKAIYEKAFAPFMADPATRKLTERFISFHKLDLECVNNAISVTKHKQAEQMWVDRDGDRHNQECGILYLLSNAKMAEKQYRAKQKVSYIVHLVHDELPQHMIDAARNTTPTVMASVLYDYLMPRMAESANNCPGCRAKREREAAKGE